MFRVLFKKMITTMKNRYDYDTEYLQDMLDNDVKAFSKYMGFQIMASHNGNLPAGPLYAARLRAILWDDCGPCAQLMVNMAIKADVEPDIIQAIINKDLKPLPEEVALVVQFTESILARNSDADELREQILALWGKEGLIAIGFCIGSSRVYPALKYTMGYGETCSRIHIANSKLVPQKN